MNKIENIKQVEALIRETYMYSIIIALIALALAFLITNLILYQGGKIDHSNIKRRIWYIMIGLIAPISFFIYNIMIVSDKITKAPLQSKFSSANILATLAMLGIYIIAGILTMIIFRRSKWGSILGRSK